MTYTDDSIIIINHLPLGSYFESPAVSDLLV